MRDGIDPENFTEYIYSKTDEDIMVDIYKVKYTGILFYRFLQFTIKPRL